MAVKLKIERRPLYGKGTPFLGLGDVFAIVKKIAETGGQDGTFDVLTKVFDNKLTSSRFKLKLAALRVFGLISTGGETSYSLTPLAVSYIHPVSENGQVQAMQTAFLKLPTLRQIWENQKGKTIPAQFDFFANYLVQTFGVPESLKMKWAKYFVYAGVASKVIEERPGGYYVNLVIGTTLNQNGKTNEHKPDGDTPKTQFERSIQEHEEIQSDETINYSRTLTSGGELTLLVPESPSAEDAREIVARCQFVIKAMKGFMED